MKILPIIRTIGLSVFFTSGTVLAENPLWMSETPDSLSNVPVSSEMLDIVSTALPESQRVDQNFLNQSYTTDVYLSDDSRVAITFIDEGAGYRNALGYYTYSDSTFSGLRFSDIDTDSSGNITTTELSSLNDVSVGMIFPNASKQGGGGLLTTGDTYVLGSGEFDYTDESTWEISGGDVFDEGTNLGFFLVANGWNDYGSTGTVDGWAGQQSAQQAYYSSDFLNSENSDDAEFDTRDYKARHVALTFSSQDRNTLILGFEDLNRLGNSDDDFNDAVFLVRANPIDSLKETKVEVYSAPHPMAGAGIIYLSFFALLGMLSKRRRN